MLLLRFLSISRCKRSSYCDVPARSLTWSAVKPKIFYYGISKMIDPSITGRVGLADPSGNTRGIEAKWRRRKRNGWKTEICGGERRVEKKREAKADP